MSQSTTRTSRARRPALTAYGPTSPLRILGAPAIQRTHAGRTVR